MPVFDDTIAEGLGLTQLTPVGVATAAADDLGLSPHCTIVYRQLVTASDTLGLAPVAEALRGVVLIEALRLSTNVIPNQKVNVSSTETLGLVEQLLPGLPVTIAETLALSISQSIQHAVSVIEELGLSDELLPAAVYNLAISETIGLASSLANFFGADITESLNLAPLLSSTGLSQATLTETLGLAETQTANLVLRVMVEEELGLEDVDLLNAIYQGTITEDLQLVAAYLSPGGGFTTWAMNTRTAAVTEYDNYEFNSFARLGDKYLGATSEGLYELIGDDDAGTDIIARIKSGFAQWAGTKFTLFKGIYLGVRGEGDFVLRLISGEGQTYDYAVSTRDMRSTKVHMGKGLRARYFRFELISTGQDFDLESIEFVPLVAERRV